MTDIDEGEWNLVRVTESSDQHLERVVCDVLLITATEIEVQAVRNVFQTESGYKFERLFGDANTYYDLGVIGQARVFMVQTQMGSSGPSGSHLIVQESIKELSPAAVIMVGIAFGVNPKKQKIGDILVSRQLVPYEPQRVGSNPDSQLVIKSRGDRMPCSPRLQDRFRSGVVDWQGAHVEFGLILSGEKLVDNQNFRDQLLQLEPEAIGGEMEGTGLYAASYRNAIDWIVVKAICDWGDGKKNQNKRRRQQKAANNAASFTLHVLRQGGLTRNQTGSLSSPPVNSSLTGTPEDTVQSAASRSPICMVPYERNYFFIGRENELEDIHYGLSGDSGVALTQTQAISGLGGVGKTQVALEYIYRYRNEYCDIFWVRAETEVALRASFIDIAELLGLPEHNAPDPDEIAHAVKKWLENRDDWLLIFDNADTPELLKTYRPRNPKGHILITSRAQVFDMLSVSRPIELKEMLPDEASAFLFKRTGRNQNDPMERKAATELAKQLGYLPLALEQASAYITAKQVRFQDYLASYRVQHLRLLNKSLPRIGDYPESVATTWIINFQEIEKAPGSADLLRLSAFLDADHIPLELIAKGATLLGPTLSDILSAVTDDPVVINEVLEPLTRYSLIHRDIDVHTYSIHRLVQEVIKDEMEVAAQQLWSKRVVHAIEHIFPQVEVANWPLCQRYLAQALQGIKLIEQWSMEFPESVELLERTGAFLYEQGQYLEAKPLFQRALTICEKYWGLEQLYIDILLSGLGAICQKLGKYKEAEDYFTRALMICRKFLGLEHPATLLVLNNLGTLYNDQAQYRR